MLVLSRAPLNKALASLNTVSSSIESSDSNHRRWIRVVGVLLLAFGMGVAGYGRNMVAVFGLLVAVTSWMVVLRRRTKVLLGALVAIAALAGGILVATEQAELQARSFCSRFSIGDLVTRVADAAANAGEARLRRISPNEVSVGFTGAGPLDRHICIVEGEGGKVTKVSYAHLD
jgi:hypothetical protein